MGDQNTKRYDGNQLHKTSWASNPQQILDSIETTFSYPNALDPSKKKLREPQVGALHAILSHWTINKSKIATVVMPTGTGKTETMLAAFCAERPKKLLVLVPSVALRKQIAGKFMSLGVLPKLGILEKGFKTPFVGIIEHGFMNKDQAEAFVEDSNVIVSTVSALHQSSPAALNALMDGISHVFVDEAHHIAAKTWQQLLDLAADKPILQFTATPYRRDGQRVEGRIIYSYPLSKAQKQELFSRINYYSVTDFMTPDVKIAKKAIELLRKDIADGKDHVLMARVKTQERAKSILPIYEELAPDLFPVLLHSGEAISQQKKSLAKVESGTSRIVICVNMLGEGYDLPQLKVAAIHDPHKSLAITLQFIGRFARVNASKKIGDASVVIERTGIYEDENLVKLYADDNDWNEVIKDLSESAVEEQEELQRFEGEFKDMPPEVSLKNLLPKMSTVVYKTDVSTWSPEKIYNIFPKKKLLTKQIAINNTDHVTWFVTEEKTEVEWGDVKNLKQVNYDLYVLFWDKEQNLLFINSSNKDTLHTKLAKVVCGDTAELIHGDVVYRAMANVNRLVPTNVGLLDSRNRKRSFTSYSGANVTSGLPKTQTKTKVQTNIFGHGYESGDRVNIGVSLKGRLWARKVAPTLKHWTEWCSTLGKKLLDETIDVEKIRKNFLRPELVTSRPNVVPISIVWPYTVYTASEGSLQLHYQGKTIDVVDAPLRITDYGTTGPIKFSVGVEDKIVNYQATFGAAGISFYPIGADATIKLNKETIPLSKYINATGLGIYFEDDTTITHTGYLLKYKRSLVFDPEKIKVLDWKDIDLKKESQGKNRDKDSVQARTIEYLQAEGDWDLIIDDDGPGEVADIVAIKVRGQDILVHLVHCKYASTGKPAARIEDLYEVCGQAQKSMLWGDNLKVLISNLCRREKNRQQSGRDGIIVGTLDGLLKLETRAKRLIPEITVSISQPGLSKSLISAQQQQLLACTETYLNETYEIGFEVLANS